MDRNELLISLVDLMNNEYPEEYPAEKLVHEIQKRTFISKIMDLIPVLTDGEIDGNKITENF